MVEDQQTAEKKKLNEASSEQIGDELGPHPAEDTKDNTDASKKEEEIEEEIDDSDFSEEDQEGEEEIESSGPSLDEQLTEAEEQLAKQKDQNLRLNAEFENYKRRITKEMADRLKYYHMSLVKELLPALDSLEKAIEHAQKDNTSAETLLEGVEMVYKLNQEALEKFSVSKIDAVGEAFDPNIHQAVGTVESEEIPEDHVVDQFQVGYMLHDRLIRPSMVRVSKKI